MNAEAIAAQERQIANQERLAKKRLNKKPSGWLKGSERLELTPMKCRI